jgi:hypothetical protein
MKPVYFVQDLQYLQLQVSVNLLWEINNSNFINAEFY